MTDQTLITLHTMDNRLSCPENTQKTLTLEIYHMAIMVINTSFTEGYNL